MDTTTALILATVFALVALRIYQKYFRKDQKKPDNTDGSRKETFPSSEDDYEPYSGKQTGSESVS